MIENPDRSISDVQKIIQWHLKTIYNIIFTVEKGKAYLHTSYENNYDKRKPSYNTLYYKGYKMKHNGICTKGKTYLQ